MPRKPRSYLRGELVVVIDCSDLSRSADFWASVLGYVLDRPGSDRYQTLLPADGDEILLQRVPERKQGKNRLHLDFAAADMDAEVARLVALGGQKVQTFDQYTGFTVMLDPEGNEFCIVRERPS